MITHSHSLTSLLSETLIAFTIEADNRFEQQMNASPHRPFLVSLVMWANFLRLVPDAGIPVRELSTQAGIPKAAHPALPGMTRWGYVKVEPAPENTGSKSSGMNAIIHLTPAGQTAKAIWQSLPESIEARWRQRFGPQLIETLRSSLTALLPDKTASLPLYLPVLMNSGFRTPDYACPPETDSGNVSLPTLLSRVLINFTLEFEQTAELSLPISLNVLRVINTQGILLRDLPQLAGISKQAISMSLTYLIKQGDVTQAAAGGKAGKTVSLTAQGKAAQDKTQAQLSELEQRWRERYGKDLQNLRETLGQIIDHERFSEGLVPPAGCWRGMKPFSAKTQAVIENPHKLPQYPMVLHRGGYPDGS